MNHNRITIHRRTRLIQRPSRLPAILWGNIARLASERPTSPAEETERAQIQLIFACVRPDHPETLPRKENNLMTVHAFVKTYRSEWLMLAFVAQMLASPFADSHPKVGGVLALSLFGLILLGFRSLASRKVVDFAILPLSALWLTARILEALSNTHASYTKAAPAAGLALSCAILWAMQNRFRSARTGASNVIAEAFISYLVIASAFSQLYSLLDRVFPNCFNQTIAASQSGTLLYFSMITLSSVGYGGILPINPYIRLIAALESMIGIFYIAVVVSRLVAASAKVDRTKDR
jgi:hypothetical protein